MAMLIPLLRPVVLAKSTVPPPVGGGNQNVLTTGPSDSPANDPILTDGGQTIDINP